MGLIYLDSCLLIYLTERHALWAELVANALTDVAEARFAISPLVKFECLIAPLKRGDPVLQSAYFELFALFVSLAMPEAVYLRRQRFAPAWA